jgi:hypothetical protein
MTSTPPALPMQPYSWGKLLLWVPKSYGNPKRSTNASSSFGWSSWIGVGRREIATAQHPFQQFVHLVLPRGGDGRPPNGAMLLLS